MPLPRLALDRLPLKPGTASSVLAASLTLVTSEFVRSGMYGAYFTQVIDTQYHLPVAVAGMVVAAHMIADTLMRAPAGSLIQKYGPQKVAFAGAVLSLVALSLLLLPAAHSIWMVILIAALHGIGFSPVWPAMMNLTADAALPGYEGRTLTLVTSSLMPLVGLGFMVYGAVAKNPDFPIMAMTLGLLVLAVLATLLLPARRLIHHASEEDQQAKPPSASLRRLVLPLLPAALMQTLTQAIVGNWLFRIAPELGLGYWDLIALLAVGGVVAFGAMPRTGKIADGGRARLAVTVGYVLVAAGMLGFALTPPVWALFVLAPVVGLGYAFVTPGWAALVAQTLPEAQRPAAWGILMTVENGGMALGPALGGLTYQLVGAPGPFGLNAVLSIVTAGGYILFRQHFPSTNRSAPAANSEPVHVAPTPAHVDADYARLQEETKT
ncbi:MFS transporter [Deinococcus fonticola]|uniref:MFS transporter n=1 Tax=Deinococcus fonticola TaxID=2528713 RepID=UPI0010751A3A|nr:MFS transporter [Deinococcus fonticola]